MLTSYGAESGNVPVWGRTGIVGFREGPRTERFKFDLMIVGFGDKKAIGTSASITATTGPHAEIVFDLPAVPPALIEALEGAPVGNMPLPEGTAFTLDCGTDPRATVDASGAHVSKLAATVTLGQRDARASFRLVAQGLKLRECLPWPVRA